MTAPRTVVIAGAGIGGLTAAIALAQRGFRVSVMEQAERLEAIGLTAQGKRRLTMADGRIETMDIGEAGFHIPELGETLTCPVIFAPRGSLYLLGATALENFGVAADPEGKSLKPILAIIGGFLGSR